jgi:hypothetical protein
LRLTAVDPPRLSVLRPPAHPQSQPAVGQNPTHSLAVAGRSLAPQSAPTDNKLLSYYNLNNKNQAHYIVEDENFTRLSEVLKLMCNQEHCLVLEETSDAVVKQVTSDVGIDSRQWIIKQVNISFFVNSSGEKYYLIF